MGGKSQQKPPAYPLSLKDLCVLPFLPELMDAKIDSFKIEGRMKSEYYLATVVNAYRRAMDGADTAFCEKELCATAHRNFTKAYAYGNGGEKTEEYAAGQVKGEYDYAANVLSFENGVVRVEMRNRFKSGDKLNVLSPGRYHGREITVGEMFSETDGETTTDAKRVQGVYSFPCEYPLHAGDLLRREVTEARR